MDNDFQKEVLQRLTKIETKMDSMQDVREKAYSADARSLKNEDDIKEMQETNKFLVRTTIGTIITGLVGIMILIFKNGMGVK